MDTDLKNLENDVVGYMRTAIANLDTDHSVVHENMCKAHDLFAEHLMEWSEDFCTLDREMREIYNDYTPREKGHYHISHVGVGYSSHPIRRWVADKVQPVPPTTIELVARFDALIQVWNARSEEITS